MRVRWRWAIPALRLLCRNWSGWPFVRAPQGRQDRGEGGGYLWQRHHDDGRGDCMSKRKTIRVKETPIRVVKVGDEDYISLTVRSPQASYLS